MNCEPVISVEHLSKSYVLRKTSYGGMKGALLHFFQYVREASNTVNFDALSDLSFKIYPGETVALVGPNGCGKTTLLSIIGGVIRGYSGTVTVHGRISMMLALGAGFVPELSGRENIILNGVLQGKTKKEMDALVDEIIEFSELGQFIDVPIFRYSSGMQMRLGFAVATAIEPEILLVDEILAVGDSEFSKKCEMRIRKLLEKNTTLILVSHNPADIQKYCKRIIRLEHGVCRFDGSADEYYKTVNNITGGNVYV